MTKHFTLVDHPLVAHKITILRDRTTPSADFRRTLKETSQLLAFEATRDLPVTTRHIETPLEAGDFPAIDEENICLVSILRAGNGLLDGVLELMPTASVAFVGLARDHETLEAKSYYFKAPADLARRTLIIVDPMLATGHTSLAAIEKLKSNGATSLRLICLVAAPEGVSYLKEHAPDVPIFAGALDRQLNEIGYILPGLGDAGDRIYGTEG